MFISNKQTLIPFCLSFSFYIMCLMISDKILLTFLCFALFPKMQFYCIFPRTPQKNESNKNITSIKVTFNTWNNVSCYWQLHPKWSYRKKKFDYDYTVTLKEVTNKRSLSHLSVQVLQCTITTDLEIKFLHIVRK